jgi:hypothetical protein
MFAMLVLMDFLAQLATSAGIVEFQALVGLWFGPLDDIFYSVAGLQALYFMIDPNGETRDPVPISTVATIKKIAHLLSQERYRRGPLPGAFFTGSLRSAGFLGDGLLLVVVAGSLTSSLGLDALLLVMQRHLTYLLPITLAIGATLLWANQERAARLWLAALGGSAVCLLISVVVDGRWSHHVHHLLASISSLQAWGATLCWTAAASQWPLGNLLRVEPDPAESIMAEAT